jgi:hypothetical protein
VFQPPYTPGGWKAASAGGFHRQQKESTEMQTKAKTINELIMSRDIMDATKRRSAFETPSRHRRTEGDSLTFIAA